MATEFIQTSIFSSAYVLTSDARSISASTDEPKLSVSLTCAGDTFYSEELYAFNGTVELFDPGSVIEDYFIAHQLICESVTVTFGTASVNLNFLYCENVMPYSFNPSNVFLLSSRARRVHKDSLFTVAEIPVDSESPFVIKVVGHNLLGKIESVLFNESSGISHSEYTTLSVPQIIGKATGRIDSSGHQIANIFKDIMYFSVEHSGRQLMCYITPSPAYMTFRFRNIFNVPELVDIEGSLVKKTEASRQTAICFGDICQYDRRIDRTYQFTTGPLTADEFESVVQLVSSHSVQLYSDNSFYDVVIEDHTCDESSDDESLSVIKFTWRFKGRRPVNFNSSLFGIQSTNRNIFSDEYSPEYE